MIAAKLTVEQGPIPNQTFELTEASLQIGRSADNQIVINDAEVSRRHARIIREQDEAGARFLIEDLGSTNGTFINGLRCTTRTALTDGDVIEFGESVRLVFSREAAAPPVVDESEYDTADLPPLPPMPAKPAAPPPRRAQPPATSPPPAQAPEDDTGVAARWSTRRIVIGCVVAGLLLICACGGLLIFLDAYQGGRLLYCGGLRPLFELLLGPFGFSPICP